MIGDESMSDSNKVESVSVSLVFNGLEELWVVKTDLVIGKTIQREDDEGSQEDETNSKRPY